VAFSFQIIRLRFGAPLPAELGATESDKKLNIGMNAIEFGQPDQTR
jgi:hypothetical protein